MVGRKVIAALISGLLMVTMYSISDGIGIGIFFGMYLLPIIFVYGIPSSVLSDYATKSFKGTKRIVASFLLHLFLATLFVPIPMWISGSTWFSGITGLLDVFFFISALITAILFWITDELIKIKHAK